MFCTRVLNKNVTLLKGMTTNWIITAKPNTGFITMTQIDSDILEMYVNGLSEVD